MKAIVLYLHVHQPYRVRPYTIFDISSSHQYFNDSAPEALTNNQWIIQKIAGKSYFPTNARLLKLLRDHSDFKISLSMSGVVIEQMEAWAPEAVEVEMAQVLPTLAQVGAALLTAVMLLVLQMAR